MRFCRSTAEPTAYLTLILLKIFLKGGFNYSKNFFKSKNNNNFFFIIFLVVFYFVVVVFKHIYIYILFFAIDITRNGNTSGLSQSYLLHDL